MSVLDFYDYENRHKNRDGTPLIISFLVTNRCNLKCKHCFYHQTTKGTKVKDQEEMTIDEYLKLSKSMEPFRAALLCGGEPYMRDDLHEIVRILHANNKIERAGTSTNGQLTTNIIKQVSLICSQNRDLTFGLNFSLEGFEETNDFIRGKGTFKRSIQTWKECKKIANIYNNLRLGVTFTINLINQNESEEFINWVIKELQPDVYGLMKTRQSPRGGEELKDISLEKYNTARKAIIKYIKEGKIGDAPAIFSHYVYQTIADGKRSFHCYAGKHGGFINYNGDVNVCEVFPDAQCSDQPLKLGNLRDYDMDFLKLWNSEHALKIKQLVGKHPACEMCTHETEGILPSMFFEPNISDFSKIDIAE